MFIPTPIASEEEKGEGRKSLAVSIQEDLDTLPHLSMNWCIYRVPDSLRELNKKAFTPVCVSIGPLHYKNKDLQDMEPHKRRCLQSFLSQTETNKDLSYYVQFIGDMEARIREAYAAPIRLSSEAFIQMVLVDSAFIIQLFRFKLPDIRPFHNGLLTNDLMLAENQLPFFILKDLYEDAFSNSNDGCCFTDIACRYFKLEKCRMKVDNTTNEAVCFHFLDMIRTRYLLTRHEQLFNQNVDEGSIRSIHCCTATSLYKAGVKFYVLCGPTTNLLDIWFDKDKGVLTIPKMVFVDKTEAEFRNLVAFEQSHYDTPYFGHYLFFLSGLINSLEDVKLLVKAGVIEILSGDIIKFLGTGVYFQSTQSYMYRETSKQLNDYCNRRRKPWNQWKVISVYAGSILLFLAVVQVIVGILDVPGVMKKS